MHEAVADIDLTPEKLTTHPSQQTAVHLLLYYKSYNISPLLPRLPGTPGGPLVVSDIAGHDNVTC